ncbi:MAG: tail fiber domain-containing protein [Chitinophagales bacterium]
MRKLFTIIFFISINSTYSQNVGINSTGAAPNASAILDVASANKGILIPNINLISTTDVTTITSPATSLLVYNTNASISGVGANGVGFYYFNGTNWIKLMPYSSSGNTWFTTGNSATIDGTNFIGTTDNVPLNFRINNNKAGRIDSMNANVFLGSLAGSNTTTQYNTALGHFALKDNMTGTFNTAFGANTLLANVNGNANTAIGEGTMQNLSSGSNNTAIGIFALSSGFGNENVAIGNRAMQLNNGCSQSVGIGTEAVKNSTATGIVGIGYNSLKINTSGDQNTAVGYQTLLNNNNGSYNTAVGYNALTSNQASCNTAIGNIAMQSNNSGRSNTAIGDSALAFNSGINNYNVAIGSSAMSGTPSFAVLGSENVAIGYRSMNRYRSSKNTAVGMETLLNTTTDGNTAVGYRSITANQTGIQNTAVGYQTLKNNLLNKNTAIGYNVLQLNNFSGNTAIGNEAFSSSQYGAENVVIGNLAYNALGVSGSGNNNVVIGSQAMSLGYGDENVAIGSKALYNTTTGTSANTGVGTEVLYNNTAALNTAVGYKALRTSTTSTDNTAVGANALFSTTTGKYNTATGSSALYSNQLGKYNTATGYLSQYRNTDGSFNTSVGDSALYFNQLGSYNTAIGNSVLVKSGASNNTGIGSFALSNNTNGLYNTATGKDCLTSNDDGSQNVGNGNEALYNNTSGNNNTAIGYQSSYSNTNGSYNTSIGYQALKNMNFGQHNVAVGDRTLSTINFGDNNTALGYKADVSSGNSNSTAIGAFAQVDQSNAVVLGSINGVNGAAASASVGIGTTTPTSTLDVNGQITIQQKNFGGNAGLLIQGSSSVPNYPNIGFSTLNNFGLDVIAANITGSIDNNTNGNEAISLKFATTQTGTAGLTTRMIVSSNGNVGIGTVAPNAPLQFGNFVSNRKIVFYEASNNDHQFNGFGLNPGVLRFQVNNTGDDFVYFAGTSSTTSNEVMRIKGNGNVGIGVAPTQKLHVAGNGLFTGTVTASCGVLICSDIRYKKGIQPLQDVLSKITKLQGVSYYFKKKEFKDKNFNDNKQIGLIAQEVEKIYPELVFTDEQGYKSIDYSKLTPILVEAVKALELENQDLKNNLTALNTRMVVIEKILINSLTVSNVIKP